MIDKNKKLHVPREEKLYITPEVREKLFIDMINEYNKRFPNLTLEYAYINKDPEIPMDYILLFKTKNIEGTVNLTVYDCPMLYSDRSIPGYRYCKRTGKLDLFFEEAVNSMVRLPEFNFIEFVTGLLQLEYADENSEKYWKNEAFAASVARNLMELSTRYVQK